MTLQAALDTLRRLALVFAFAACVCMGAILGAIRELLRTPLAALHSWLGRVLAVLALALLLTGCHPPRTTAHLAGTFRGERVPDITITWRGDYHSTSSWGQRWTWSAEGTEKLPHAPRWDVLDAEGRVLTSARGSREVPIFYPPGAAYLRVLLPWNVTCFSYSPEGGRQWRVVYVRRIGAVQVAEAPEVSRGAEVFRRGVTPVSSPRAN